MKSTSKSNLIYIKSGRVKSSLVLSKLDREIEVEVEVGLVVEVEGEVEVEVEVDVQSKLYSI